MRDAIDLRFGEQEEDNWTVNFGTEISYVQ